MKKNKKVKESKNILDHVIDFGENDRNVENFCGYLELEYRKSEDCKTFFGDNFVYNNIDKCIIEINDNYMSIEEFLKEYNCKNIPLNIKILLKSTITDLSYMFYNCTSLKKINMFFIDNKYNNITNMSYMFYNCESLIEIPNLSVIDFSKITDISYMFYNCKNLTKFSDIHKLKLNENIITTNIFNNCKDINDLYLIIFLLQLDIKIEDILNSDFRTIIKDNYDEIISYLQTLNIENLWKFLIPRTLHKYGKDIFEIKSDILKNKEKGYLSAMFNGWQYMLDNKKCEKIDKNIYQELHNIVIRDVKRLRKNANKFRVNKSKLYLTLNFDNYEVLNNEKNALIKNIWGDNFFLNYKFYNNKKMRYSLFYNFNKSEFYKNFKKYNVKDYSEYILQLYFNIYYQKKDELEECEYIEYFKNKRNFLNNDILNINEKYNILTTTNKIRKCKINKKFTKSLLPKNSSYYDKLLEIIVTTCKLIMESHFFYDGNKRTISLLLNMMLIENKIFPTILEDPLILIKNTIPEIMNKVKEGQYYVIKTFLNVN